MIRSKGSLDLWMESDRANYPAIDILTHSFYKMLSYNTTKYMRKKMALIWERKEKNVAAYLLKGPFTFFLIFVNTLLASWVLHVSFAIFSDAQDHMSIIEWIKYLYGLLP